MSKGPSINKLRQETLRYGTQPYLLTQDPDGRPHAVGVPIEWLGDCILACAGSKSTANVAARPCSACYGRQTKRAAIA